MKDKIKRKQLLINRKFQLMFLLKFIIFYAFIIVLFFLVMDIFVESEADSISRRFLSMEEIKSKFRTVIVTLSFVSTLISIIMLFFFVNILSHRIAGPLHRFNAVLRELADRKLSTSAWIRRKDQLIEISESLEKLKRVLSQDITEMKNICRSNNEFSGNSSEKIAEVMKILEKYKL